MRAGVAGCQVVPLDTHGEGGPANVVSVVLDSHEVFPRRHRGVRHFVSEIDTKKVSLKSLEDSLTTVCYFVLIQAFS